MKNNIEHRVPLTREAVEILRSLPRAGDHVFRSIRGGKMHDKTLSGVHKELGRKKQSMVGAACSQSSAASEHQHRTKENYFHIIFRAFQIMNIIDQPTKNSIKTAALGMIRNRGNVSFPELHEISGFLGDCEMTSTQEIYLDIIWWMWMSPEAV